MLFKYTLFLLVANIAFINGQLIEIIDLTWNFSNETIYWTGITPFSYTKVVGREDESGNWYAMNEFCAGEHGGTHFDAPYHFYKQGWKVADVPVIRLIGKGALIDVSKNITEALLPSHLENWERDNGKFENNTILLIKFGRSKLWSDKNKYMAIDDQGKLNFPGISAEAATWIANTSRIVGVGLDTPSVDLGISTEMPTHRILSKNQIYNMENVKLLVDLPPKGFTIVALPMKLKEGTGAPLRVLAIPNTIIP